MSPDFRDYGAMKTVELIAGDPELANIPVGAVVRFEPLREPEDGAVLAYRVVDDRTGEHLGLVFAAGE